MNYAILVSDLQGVYHAQYALQAPSAPVKTHFFADAFKWMSSRLPKQRHHN